MYMREEKLGRMRNGEKGEWDRKDEERVGR